MRVFHIFFLWWVVHPSIVPVKIPEVFLTANMRKKKIGYISVHKHSSIEAEKDFIDLFIYYYFYISEKICLDIMGVLSLMQTNPWWTK